MELFFSPLACSMSARIACAEAGVAINLIEVDTQAGRVLATGEDYRAVNPLGYVPALRLDDGTVLTENAAILQFIADAHPAASLAPPESDPMGRARLRQWLSFIGTELHKGLMLPLLGRETPPEVRAWTVRKYSSRLAYLDDKLKGREFLLELDAGDAGNRSRRLPERQGVSRPPVPATKRRRGARDRDSALPGGGRAKEGGLRHDAAVVASATSNPRERRALATSGSTRRFDPRDDDAV